jgi:hypothetical protein
VGQGIAYAARGGTHVATIFFDHTGSMILYS